MFKLRWLALAFVLAVWTVGAKELKVPHVVFMIGEPEYGTRTNLLKFAQAELEPRGISCTFAVTATEDSDDFSNLEALRQADLLFISVRRHAPPPEQMKLIRDYLAAGKPVVGIRTASHAFGKKKGQKEGVWENFDHEVLGGNYQGHYEPGVAATIKPVLSVTNHPILAGVPVEGFRTMSSLYKNRGLNQADTVLMMGQLEGRPEAEPVAWVNLNHRGRVFYTSLGAAGDFNQPAFRQLLLNGVYWAMDRPVPVKKPSSASGVSPTRLNQPKRH